MWRSSAQRQPATITCVSSMLKGGSDGAGEIHRFPQTAAALLEPSPIDADPDFVHFVDELLLATQAPAPGELQHIRRETSQTIPQNRIGAQLTVVETAHKLTSPSRCPAAQRQRTCLRGNDPGALLTLAARPKHDMPSAPATSIELARPKSLALILKNRRAQRKFKAKQRVSTQLTRSQDIEHQEIAGQWFARAK